MHHDSFIRSSRSSSSQPPFLLCTVTFSSSTCCSLIAARMSLSCASFTGPRSCPLRANVMSRFSTSSAREAFTSRMRPMRSAAAGSRICASIEARASVSRCLGERCQKLCAIIGKVLLCVLPLFILSATLSTLPTTTLLLKLLPPRLADSLEVSVAHCGSCDMF